MNVKLHNIVIHMCKYGIHVLVLIQSLSILMAADINAQRKMLNEVSVEIESSNEPKELIEVFKEIESKTTFRFAYSRGEIKSKQVTLEPGSWKMDELLRLLSVQGEVSFKRVNEQIGVTIAMKDENLPALIENITVQATIRGKVIDDAGEPLPGATVIEKGTTNGTITDFQGNFSLNVSDDAMLLVSFVGFESQEIVVGGQTNITVTLMPDLESLEEVVVIGYGTQSKRYSTGAISSVDMEDVKTCAPITNVTQALGQVPGVQFINNGRPGQGGTLLMRGQNSLATNSDPLIVVDGIIFQGNIADINPQDIKSIDVLKDAASTAIYGARAANGVIMITSNKGTSSRPTIRLNANQGVSEAGRWLPMPSGEEYIRRKRDYYNQQLVVAGNDLGVDVNSVSSLLDPEEFENYENGKFTSFEDIVGRQGQLSNVDLSISGLQEKTSYLVSGSLSHDKGLILGDKQDRVSFRVNLETQIASWLKVGTSSFFAHRDLSGVPADLSDGYDNSPFGNFYHPDGNVKYNPITSDATVVNARYNYELTDNKEISKNLFSNMYMNIDFPFLEGLSYRFNYSPNFEWKNNYSFKNQDPYSASNTTWAEKQNQNVYRWVWESILKYNKSLGESHEIDVTLMYGRNGEDREQTNISASLFEIGILGYNNFGLGSNYLIDTYAEDKFWVSSLARVNYTFMEKYMLSVAARRDGSSVFGSKHKFGLFPSVALGWIASEESFMQGLNALNYMKLRVSYGENGNSAIPAYRTQSLNDNIYNSIGDNTGNPIALVPNINVMGNESIRWESTKSTNLGVDFGLWNSKVSGSVDVYEKNTTDLLVLRSIPFMNGYQTTYANVGEVNNRGVEIILNTNNLSTTKLSWQTTFSFAYNKNKINHLFGDIDGDGTEDDAPDNAWFIGKNINAFYDYEFDGIHQQNDESGNARYLAGDIRLKDLDQNDTINVEDRKVVGHGKFPNYTLTMNNTFNYGNFSLFISVNGMFDWVAPFDLVYPHGPNLPLNSLKVDYWTPENKSNKYPSLLYSNGGYNNHYYISRDFVRIRNVSLSYDFSRLGLPVLDNFSSLRLTASVTNLYTFTKWIGPDPENAQDITSNKGNDNLYPMPRTYSIGLNLSF